jgi:hypothetical protein
VIFWTADIADNRNELCTLGALMSQAWEYKIVHVDARKWTPTGLPNELNQDFDAWGAEGWELVGTEAVVRPFFGIYGSTTVGVVAFFKRPIS